MIECMEEYEQALDELFRIEMLGYENYEVDYIESLVEDVRRYEENGLMTDKEREELQEAYARG